MKDFYKNINFYYILIPAVAAVWAIFTWSMTLPAAQQKWNKIKKQYNDSQTHIAKIIKLDPDRLHYKQQQQGSADFDYTTALDKFRKLWKISPSDFDYRALPETKRQGKTAKSANLTIHSIDIKTFTQFLSTLLLPHPSLNCDQLTLTKLSGGPDSWKAVMKFTYYY